MPGSFIGAKRLHGLDEAWNGASAGPITGNEHLVSPVTAPVKNKP